MRSAGLAAAFLACAGGTPPGKNPLGFGPSRILGTSIVVGLALLLGVIGTCFALQ
jgi:hypothetical protein